MNVKQFLSHTWIILGAIALVMTSLAKPVQAKQPPSSVSFYEIDAYLEEQLDRLHIPGASLAIVEGDQIVHTRGFGVTGPGGKTPTPQTPYFIGSLTKSFTALAIMQLVEAGKVELDAPIQRYLPWFTLADPQAAAQISVRHLLNQTSGISQIPGMLNLTNFDDTPGANERQVRALATYQPAWPAGSAFEYSNINFNLLGLVIAAVSGETYTDYVQNHIFNPLAMQHSYTAKAAAQQDGLAVGHQIWFGFPVAVPYLPAPVGSLPSGQLIASAEDIGHYLIAQLNEGRYAGVQILSPEGIVQMHQPAAEVRVAGKKMSEYGMGWFINESNHKQLIFHDGEVPDYFSYMALLPEQDRAMVLLVNANQQIYNYALWAASEAAAFKLANIPIQPDSWGILPWAMRGSLLLPVLQIIVIIAALRRIEGWRLGTIRRPSRLCVWLLDILLPITFDLALVAIAVGTLASGMLKFIMLFLGDLTIVFLFSGGIALVWIFVRALSILRAYRTPSKIGMMDPG